MSTHMCARSMYVGVYVCISIWNMKGSRRIYIYICIYDNIYIYIHYWLSPIGYPVGPAILLENSLKGIERQSGKPCQIWKP